MFKSYFKLSLRNLIRNRFHTLTNITGLGLGFAIGILIFLFIQHELSYNKYPAKQELKYRLNYRFIEADGTSQHAAFVPDELAEIFRNDIPQITKIAAYRDTRAMIGYKNQKYQLKLAFAEPDFLELFSLDFLAGDRGTAFDNPQSTVISRSTADKIFGTRGKGYEELIGTTLTFPHPDVKLYLITGVFEDVPNNSTLRYDLIAPWINAMDYPRSNNSFGANHVYFELQDKNQIDEVEESANKLVESNWGEGIAEAVKFGMLQDSEDNFQFYAVPIADIYLKSENQWGYDRKGNLNRLYILASIGILILLIACINYIMLNIGQSINRMKSMGLMNIVGARKSQIVRLFLTEVLMVTTLSMFLGVVLSEQLLPLFNRLSQEEIEFTLYHSWTNLAFLAGILLLIVVLTSSYVTYSLYRINHPLAFVRGETKLVDKSRFARVFVSLQYLITITLMISGIMIAKQLNFLRERPVGFEEKDVLVLHTDFEYNKIQILKERFRQHPSVLNVTSGDRNFMSGSSSSGLKNKEGEIIDTRFLRVDPEYVNALNLTLTEGRDFIRGNKNDENRGIIVNETFVKRYRIEEPAGELIINDTDTMQILGVVKDFHFDPLSQDIAPLILHVYPRNNIWYIFVRTATGNIQETLDILKKEWEQVVPEYSFDYQFLSGILDSQYENEERWSKVTVIAAVIAILLSCLGLLGISSLLVSKRVKEIGIRKVNGATMISILLLLYRDILKWVVIAFLIASPLAWYILQRWLQNFAYRAELSWWIFLAAGGAATLISVLTISWQSLRAARINPVECLRYE